MNRCEVYADHRWILTDEGMRCSKCGRPPQEESSFAFTDYVRAVFRRGATPRQDSETEEEEPAPPEKA